MEGLVKGTPATVLMDSQELIVACVSLMHDHGCSIPKLVYINAYGVNVGRYQMSEENRHFKRKLFKPTFLALHCKTFAIYLRSSPLTES